jgi:hypothetical protein
VKEGISVNSPSIGRVRGTCDEVDEVLGNEGGANIWDCKGSEASIQYC